MSSYSGIKKLRKSQKFNQTFGIVVKWIIGVFLIIFSVFPLVWIISASFNPASTLATQTLIPRNPGLDN